MNYTEHTLLIDVRSPAEYAEAHIDGTLNIPHEQVDAIAEAIGEDKDRHVILFCRSGGRVGMTLPHLLERGYTNLYNGGGVTDVAQALGFDLVAG